MSTADSEEPERPTKRLKLDSTEPEHSVSNISLRAPLVESEKSRISPEFDQTESEDALAAQAAKEAEVGITDFVNNQSQTFRGVLKKRYTDFQVNEILPNGEVSHLLNLKPPRSVRRSDNAQENGHTETPRQESDHESTLDTGIVNKPAHSAESQEPSKKSETPSTAQEALRDISDTVNTGVSVDDKALLTSYFNETATEELLVLYAKILASPNVKPKEHGIVRTDFTSDRIERGKIHESIRRIFDHRVDSSTDSEGFLILSAALPSFRKPGNQPGRGGRGGAWGDRRGGKPSWTDRGGEYLHFNLFKENKDTMEVVAFLARELKTNAKAFQFAGTKDRRAVTVQRISAFRIDADRVAALNRTIYGSKLGDFEYQPRGLTLGDLKGNEFVITLRDCRFSFDEDNSLSMADKVVQAQAVLHSAMQSLHENGFTNYYGLQRFGTFTTRTDTIGLKILQQNFAGACEDILTFNPDALAAAQNPDVALAQPIGKDDKARAEAIHIFQTKGHIREALEKLPRKFSAEMNVIKHLGRNRNDHYGALMMVPRNLRLMYVHAYQSFVWNHAAAERWRLHGSKVVAGDLVLVDEHVEKVEGGCAVPDQVDADGEIVVQPGGEDRSNTADDAFERARPLTAEEAASGAYDIFDVVLPLPGYDILYPANAIGTFYETFMASERGGTTLNPHDMRRKQRDFSLSGSYRKVMARIGRDYGVEVKAYSADDEQFVPTDLDKIKIKTRSSADIGNEHLRTAESKETKPDADAVAASAAAAATTAADKLAVIFKLQLGSSQYATMALRELMKGGVEPWKPDYGGRG